jgi:hypothetical protein
MVMMSAADGKVIATLPIGRGSDGAGFNPKTMEAFSSQGDGTLTVIKENSPTDFAVEQNVETPQGAKTMTIDGKTNHILLMTAEYATPTAAPTPPAGAPPADGRGPGGRGGGRGGRGQMVPDSFMLIEVGK